MERHSFRIVSGESQNCAFRQNFYTRKLGEITVFYTVLNRTLVFYRLPKLKKALEIVLVLNLLAATLQYGQTH